MEELLKGYRPLYMDEEEKGCVSYICTKKRTLFRVLIVFDSDTAAEIIPFMLNQTCKDFVEHFYLDGRYAAVYTYRQGRRLSELTGLPQQERVEIAKNITEGIIKRKVDYPLAVNTLTEKSILIEGDNQISFVYGLPDTNANKNDLFGRLADIVSRLWRGGTENKLCEDAESWLKKLNDMQFSSIYEAYAGMPTEPFALPAVPIVQEKAEKLNETCDGYWEFKHFYVKKKPIIVTVTILAILFGIIIGVVMPLINAIGGGIWDIWSAEAQCFSVHSVKRLLRF